MAPRMKVSEYHIPLHIQEEIMKRLPVKSLVEFRSVSKAWKSLIDSSHFIAAHSLFSHMQPHHLLVSYDHPKEEEIKYYCFVDDETLLHQKPVATIPPSIKQLPFPNIVGISRGLVCLYSPHSKRIVLWNPSVRKSKSIDVVVHVSGQTCVGFGVCPVTSDPKIVVVKQSWDKAKIETSYQCEVMVYTLSSGKWRSLSTNLPTKPILDWSRVVATDVDGYIYWRGGILPNHNMVISFDVTNESFQVIALPRSLARHAPAFLCVYKLRESLAILQHHRNHTYTVWMMEDGVQRSFIKLLTLKKTFNLPGFRKGGVPIVEGRVDGHIKLVVYEPNLEHNNILDIPGRPIFFRGNTILHHPIFFRVNSYVESLLLLDRSDCRSY